MKTLLFLVGLVVIALVAIIPWYLGPDDLVGCTQPEMTGACGKADAIIAVSGGDTTARTAEAIKLLKQGWADKLIVSGAAADPESPSNAKAMSAQALEAGVPYESILTDELARTTQENAKNTSGFVKGLGLRKVIVVTSAYHQRRAALEFGAILGKDVRVLHHPVAKDKQWSGFWWWTTPSGWWLASSELVKILAFHIAAGAQKP